MVYGQTTNAQDIQMNAVRKINSLLSSGTVSVTGPTQSRIKPQQKTVFVQKGECYVCDEHIGNNGTLVTEAITTVSNTKIPTKIGRIVGDAFMVIVSVDDVICKRCLTMFNHMDRLENDLERVKANILALINNKYGINDNGGSSSSLIDAKPPPAKVQRLNTSVSSGGDAIYLNRKTNNISEIDDKSNIPLLQPIQVTQLPTAHARINNDAVEHQLSTFNESNDRQQQQPQQLQLVRQQVNATTITQYQAQSAQPKKPIKIYKCMSCDFKTTDLKQFQPHYDTCRQQNGYRCKVCKKSFTNVNALKAHNAEKHASEFTCSICSINYLNENAFKKHMETNHPDIKTIETSSSVVSGQLHACNICTFKTFDKPSYDEHLRKHVKLKPFKCRICSARFESREQAGIHAKTHCPDYFKCGTCSMSFPQRDLLIKHFDTHKPQQAQVQQKQIVQQIQQPLQDLTTQKLLQETIDEALRDTGDSGPKIHFFSCHICSLTFIQETYYKQHMETHKRESNKKDVTAVTTASTPTSSSNARSLIRSDQRIASTPTTIIQTNQTNTSISDSDLESMFEKMHSDKTEIDGNTNNAEGLVITSQESSTGGYTFNITMPTQHGLADNNNELESKNKQDDAEGGIGSIGIDMPVLDQSEEHQLQLQQQQQQHDQDHQLQSKEEQEQYDHNDKEEHSQNGGSVSMPSLDDDGNLSQPSNTDQVPMDLDEIQNAAESGQIKFILNENGQLIQLDNNHILTTDADGNQILVQGTDSEQIQQLLQSVGVLQGDGDGEQTFQMIQGENNQMILVQGDNNEAQLIDASMLNEDGHLIIQQHGDDELPEGMHMVNEDGVQVPVSLAFAQHLNDANAEQQQHEQHEEHDEEEQQQHTDLEEHEQLQQQEDQQTHSKQLEEQDEQIDQKENQQSQEHEEQSQHDETDEHETASIKLEETSQDGDEQLQQVSGADTSNISVTTSTTAPTSTTGEMYFNLDELMNQPDQK